MINIEGINHKETDEISGELSDLKEEINEISEIESTAKKYGIPSDITNEYIKILKDFYAPNKIPNDFMDKNLESQLGFILGELELYNQDGVILYYIKKLCPNKYKDIALLVMQMIANEWIRQTPGRLNVKYGNTDPEQKVEGQNNYIKDIMHYIELYGDDVYNILKFCSPFEGSYIKNAILQYNYRTKNNDVGTISEEEKQIIESGRTTMRTDSESRSMLTQFFENFIYEPESINLLNFLKDNPQTLDNLGGKEIKSINLSLNSGINFAFRGIIEMIKSRSDINFPHLKDNPTEEEKSQRKQEWEKIIKEYESMLRNYIAKDFQKGKDEIENKKEFDRIFFTMPYGDGVVDDYMQLPDNWVQQFSGNEVMDYSFNKDKDSEEVKREVSVKMLKDIENYVNEHPNEKILVCVVQHGNPDGSSGNGWSKEDWLKLSNLSDNIKIWSIRCYFGTAFDNKDIYNNKGSVSGFSNLSTANATVSEAINGALSKGLGFHEMEIYTRLNYPVSVAPLTESMEYTNQNTGETEIGKIGLAQNNKQDISNINYA